MCGTIDDIEPTKHGVYLAKKRTPKPAKVEAIAHVILHGDSSSDEASHFTTSKSRRNLYVVKAAGERKLKFKKKKKAEDSGSCGDEDCDCYDGKWRFFGEEKDSSDDAVCCRAHNGVDKRHKVKKKKNVMVFKPSQENDVMVFKPKKEDKGRRCCSGGDSDGWLCDKCRRRAKKKTLIVKDVAATSSTAKTVTAKTVTAKTVTVKSKSASDSSSSDDSCDYYPSDCCCEADCSCSAESDYAKECDAWINAAKQKKENSCNCRRPGCSVCVVISC